MTVLWITIAAFVLLIAVGFFVAWRNEAALRRSGMYPAAGQATMADVERLAQVGQKIAAIRCYREIHRVGLAEAKKAVEDLDLDPERRQGFSASRSEAALNPSGEATMADVERFARAGQTIAAIRCYREIHHVGLAEAKKAVEDLNLGHERQ